MGWKNCRGAYFRETYFKTHQFSRTNQTNYWYLGKVEYQRTYRYIRVIPYEAASRPWGLVNTGQTTNTIQNNEVCTTNKSNKSTYTIPHLQGSTLIGWAFYKTNEWMVLKWGFKTHLTRQNNIPHTAHNSPLGNFEKWGYARCFPSTLSNFK